MSPITFESSSRKVETRSGALHYHEAGDGPPLLMLHGSGIGVSAWRNYEHLLNALADDFRCLALDFPGFGTTDPWGGHPILTAHTAVIEFLDALGLGSVAVIGNSLGGVVAATTATGNPDRVSALVTVGGIGPHIFSPGPSEGTRALHDFVADPTRENVARWLSCMVYDETLITDELVDERFAAATTPTAAATLAAMYGKDAYTSMNNAIAQSGRPPYWAMLHTISCPTLITWGIEDRQTPPDMMLLPMRQIPHAETHLFPRCGHWTMHEQREPFSRVVREFLTRSPR